MKFVLTLLLLSGSAYASAFTPHWECDATGYDSENVRRTVAGDFRSTLPQAEEAALQACARAGLDDCAIDFCFDDGLGEPGTSPIQ